jgi:hypothetical protein
MVFPNSAVCELRTLKAGKDILQDTMGSDGISLPLEIVNLFKSLCERLSSHKPHFLLFSSDQPGDSNVWKEADA